MSFHVFVRLSGYELTILPFAPFHFRRAPDNDHVLILTHHSATGTKQAYLILEDAGYQVELAPDTSSLQEVVDLMPGRRTRDWMIETTVFSMCWPRGFDLLSSPDPRTPPGFDLIGPNDTLIYIQGPFNPARLPGVEQMGAPGQQLIQTGVIDAHPWVEFDYEHEGSIWLQRHYLVHLDPTTALVVTMQAPKAHAPSSITAADDIATTLVRYQETS